MSPTLFHRIDRAARASVAASLVVFGLGCTSKNDRAATDPSAASSAIVATTSGSTVLAFDGSRMFADLEHLASDELGGRYTLGEGLRKAADHIVGEYRKAGILPVGTAYEAPFPVATGAHPVGEQTLAIGKGGKPKPLAGRAFGPVVVSGSGSTTGEVVFVGYGVKSEPVEADTERAAASGTGTAAMSYDDLAGIDLKGKIALVLMEAPGRPDLRALFDALQKEAERFAESAKPLREKKDQPAMAALHKTARKRIGAIVEPFLRGEKLGDEFYAAPENPLEAELDLMQLLRPVMEKANSLEGPKFGQDAGSLRGKLSRLADAGAVGAIVVRGPRSFITKEAREADDLEDLAKAGLSAGRALAIPVVQLRWKEADKLFRIGGKKLSKVQQLIDEKLVPSSGATGMTASMTIEIESVTTQVPNLLATIPGTDRQREIVLVGAHYDHIGIAEDGQGHCSKMTSDEGKSDTICNGADDNASGSALVLELARAMKASGMTPSRTVVFAHFAGEELGLFGSKALAENLPDAPPFRDGKIVAMVNLDMVGRLGPQGLAIGGISSSPGWMPLLDAIGTNGLKILYERSIASRSDHAPFYQKNIPVLFFFTNVHLDYHRASDHADKINREGMEKIAVLVGGVVTRLADGATVPFSPPRSPAEGLVSGLPGQNPETVEKKVKG